MKFSNPIIIFLFASLTFSYNVQKRLFKREEALELNSVTDCDEAIKKECNLEVNKNNLDTVCTTYNSDKCQNLINKGIVSLPACNALGQDFISIEQDMLKLHMITVEFMCTKDEQGNNCPFTNFELENSSIFSNEGKINNEEGNENGKEIDDTNYPKYKENDVVDEEGITAIIETCKSKKCTNALLNVIPLLSSFENNFEVKYNIHLKKRQFQFDNGMTDNEKFNKIINFLNSDECKASLNSQNSTSDAAVIKTNLLITILSL
eukprot:jgi/Orpsp1_1/1190201/evm.model.d7180000077392.1